MGIASSIATGDLPVYNVNGQLTAPPANQIVHVTLKNPAALRTMDVVWVTGTMATERQDTAMGVSGYSLAADGVEPYKAAKR